MLIFIALKLVSVSTAIHSNIHISFFLYCLRDAIQHFSFRCTLQTLHLTLFNSIYVSTCFIIFEIFFNNKKNHGYYSMDSMLNTLHFIYNAVAKHLHLQESVALRKLIAFFTFPLLFFPFHRALILHSEFFVTFSYFPLFSAVFFLLHYIQIHYIFILYKSICCRILQRTSWN